MKKNITINLCGRLFQIDEDAYEMLQHYLDSLRSAFGRQEGGDEIVDDIEARIAELFDELRQQGNEAVTISHVKEIITRIGKPEQLASEEDEQQPNNETSGHRYDRYRSAAEDIIDNVRTRTAGKKLYRNPKDKMLAGVLSGIAAYTNTDPVIWRLLTVILFFGYGFGLLVYIVLAIVLPEAKTPEQLLQMEGKEVTPQNLADVVVENNEQQEQRPNLLRSLFTLLLKVIMGLFLAVMVITGIALGIGLMTLIVSFVIIFSLPNTSGLDLPFDLGYMQLPTLFSTHPLMVVTFIVSLLLMLLIPIYAIIHLLLVKTGKVQSMGIVQRIMWMVLWFVSLCVFFPTVISLAEMRSQHYAEEYNRTHTYQGAVMSDEDMAYLKQGEWTLLKHEDCDHYTWSGLYFTGDESIRFLDSYNEDCRHVYQVEHKQKVVPGVYKLVCNGRAEGRGCYIYAVGDNKHLAEIPPYGDEGGELIEHYRRTKSELDSLVEIGQEPKWKQELCDKIIAGKDGKGYGWSTITIDNIVVTQNDSIAYGVSNDATFTDHPCRSKWFSAVDFTLTRTGDLPKK